MRKWRPKGLFLAPVMILITFAANSQRKANFSSVEFGAGPSVVSVFDNNSRTHWSPKLSGAANMGLIYIVKRNFSITAHAMLERKGGKLSYAPTVESPEQTFNATATYISLTPGVRRYFSDSGFFIEGGVFIAFLLDSKSQVVGPIEPVDAGISGSIGVTPYRTRLKGWNFRLVNNLGLSDANHVTGTKELTNSLALLIGMRMRMR